MMKQHVCGECLNEFECSNCICPCNDVICSDCSAKLDEEFGFDDSLYPVLMGDVERERAAGVGA